MTLRTTYGTADDIRAPPTTARPRVDPRDVAVPPGYTVEAVVFGLSFPCGMGFTDDGTLFVLEGGSTWPTRPYMPARILQLDTGGHLEAFAVEVLGGPRGVAYHNGAIYVSVKGGYHTHIDRYDVVSRERTNVVDGLPDGG